MTVDAFVDTHEEAKLFDCLYHLYPKQWKKQYTLTSKLHTEAEWSGFIKYLGDDGKLSTAIKQLPNDYGGIYVFFIRGMSIPFSEACFRYKKQIFCKKLYMSFFFCNFAPKFIVCT